MNSDAGWLIYHLKFQFIMEDNQTYYIYSEWLVLLQTLTALMNMKI